MDIVIIITGYFILCCAAVSFYKAIELITVKDPEQSNYMLSILLLGISYIQGALGVFYSGLTQSMPLLIFIIGTVEFIIATYMTGPLAFLYYNSLINPLKKPAIHHLILPSIASIVTIWYFLVSPRPTLIAMRNNFFYTEYNLALYMLIGGAVLMNVTYTSIILAIELSVRKVSSFKFVLRALIFITVGLICAPIALIAGFLMGYIGLSVFGGAVLCIINILFILAQTRYRDFFTYLGKEVRYARYRKSLSKGLDIETLKTRLHYLMTVEKYYRNYDISIKDAAKECAITPHQLSYYLNKKLRIDFRNYINRYRVEEAKQLLVENQGQNVLTIGFHVGFGSKTSFNVTFKEFTGKTPTEYRNEQISQGHQPLKR